MVDTNWSIYNVARQRMSNDEPPAVMCSASAWYGPIPSPDNNKVFELDKPPSVPFWASDWFSQIIGALIILSPLLLLGWWLYVP